MFPKIKQMVRVNCPSAARWPAFHAAFHGKVGKVVSVHGTFSKVDISTEKVSVPYINVDNAWLSRADKEVGSS